MKYKYLLDRVKGTQAINDGFAVICGEKHRAFLTSIGEEIIELGLKNGKIWAEQIVLKADRINSYYEMAEKKIFEQEKIINLEKDLKIFFTDQQIDILKTKHDGVDPHPQLFMKNLGQFEKRIVDTILETDITCKNPTPFFYFKEFPVSSRKEFATSCTLYSESGLGLDQYKPSSMEYQKEENELFYSIEDICRKYHYFGMMLAKQEALLNWVEVIKSKMIPTTDYFVKQFMSCIIYKLSLDSMADEVIHDVQNATAVTEAFMTHDQVTQSLAKWSKSKEGKKKLKAINDSLKNKKQNK